ncbi:MAG: radical SAM protein [Candidatus Muiribacteriota bacterium]
MTYYLKHKLPCGAVFKSPVLRADGSVTVCNYDLTLDLKIGDIDNNIFKLWESDSMKKFRLNHILKKDLPKKCVKCRPDFYLSPSETVNYLEKEAKHRVLEYIVKSISRPRVLLVNPRVSEKAPFKTTVTLGLGCIASIIEDYYDVEIINMNYSGFDNYEVVEYARKNKFNILGITGMTYQAKGAMNLANLFRELYPECLTVMGGVFATMNYDYIMNNSKMDFIISGEGEIPFLKLLKSIENNNVEFCKIPSLIYRKGKKIIKNSEAEFLEADKIPLINRSIMPTRGYIFDDITFEDTGSLVSAVVMFSRGCPSNCIFCESPHMWKRRVRIMSIERIIKEITYIIEKYNIYNFVIDDDAFTVFKDKVVEFCKTLIKKNINIKWRCNTRVNMVDLKLLTLMKKAGCVKVTYGVESGNDEILKKLNKNFTVEDVKKALKLHEKIKLPAGMLMIIGSPGETPSSIQDSLNLIEELKPEAGWDFQIMQPHPGTTLRKKIDFFGGKILTDDWDEYFSDNITYIPEDFSEKEFVKICKKVTKRPIRLSNKDKLSFSEKEGRNIFIPVDMWEEAMWNRLPAFYWKGETDFFKGYTHVLGADYGYITYNFKLDKIPEKFELSFSACSQHTEKKSELYIYINSVFFCRLTIGKKDCYGFVYKIFSGRKKTESLKLNEGVNELKFEIKEKSGFANGLSIMYKALENSAEIREKPITIVENCQ